MSDYDRQTDLDDELLSAYLDDELSPQDRAAVESRLAADPSAQQLLHQLRAVCEAVQALPQEVVGHDMRESILRQAEQARDSATASKVRSPGEHADASNGQAVTLFGDAPKFTFGRTRRGWVWASLAIAAALLIMVFGREPRRDQLADVGQREDRLEVARGRAGIPEVRAINEPAAPANEPAAPAAEESNSARPSADGFTWAAPASDLDAVIAPSAEAASEPVSEPPLDPASGLPLQGGARSLALATESQPPGAPAEPQFEEESRSFGAPRAPAPAAEVKDEVLAENVAEMPAPADRLAAATPATEFHDFAQDAALGVGTAGSAPAAATTLEDQAVNDPLLVVRVHAKRTALESKTFDQLLERSGIEVEPDSTHESVTDNFGEARRAARRFVENGQTDGAAHASDKPADAGTVDAVLVEAPPAAIESCVAGLNQDQENFLALVVDEPAAAEAKPAADSAPDTHLYAKLKLADNLDLAKYNRGTVPREQESLARDKYHFYRFEGANFGGGRLGGASADEVRLELLQQGHLSRARKTVGESNKARAVRLRERGSESALQQTQQSLVQQDARGGQANEDARADSAAAVKQELGREMREADQQAADNKLQVLFLFSFEEPAAATPTPASRGKAQ
jgi:hypothetical protein